MGSRIYTTGALRRHSSTMFLTVDAVNVDQEHFRTVTVQMFDWSLGSPVIIPMVDPSSQTLAPNQYKTFRSFQLPPTLFSYEVRIIHKKDNNLIVNVFGLSDIAFDPQNGNNAMQHDLAVLKFD